MSIMDLPFDHPVRALHRSRQWLAGKRQELARYKEQVEELKRIVKTAKAEVRMAESRMIDRSRKETPIQYYKRTGWSPRDFMRICNGRYYCNPAHCNRSWKSKKERDKHVEDAYAILG